MKPEREAGAFEEWYQAHCKLVLNRYSKRERDFWESGFRAGAEAQRERDCRALCHWCREGNPVVEANEVITANGHPFWHKVDELSIECHAAKLRSAPIKGESHD